MQEHLTPQPLDRLKNNEVIEMKKENAALKARINLIEVCNNTAALDDLRQDAPRYRQARLGHSMTVRCKSATICTGPNYERDYGAELDAALDAAMAQAVQPAYTNPVTPEEQAKLKAAPTDVFGWEKP